LNLAKQQRPAGLRLYVFQPNTGVRRFYERHGFVAVQFGDGIGNDEGVPDALYSWPRSVPEAATSARLPAAAPVLSLFLGRPLSIAV
jgi:hypothetical protein